VGCWRGGKHLLLLTLIGHRFGLDSQGLPLGFEALRTNVKFSIAHIDLLVFDNIYCGTACAAKQVLFLGMTLLRADGTLVWLLEFHRVGFFGVGLWKSFLILFL
jgi:hypothetical protein